jgi:hypothetical protein
MLKCRVGIPMASSNGLEAKKTSIVTYFPSPLLPRKHHYITRILQQARLIPPQQDLFPRRIQGIQPDSCERVLV